jgi:hypothetical protein
MLKLRTLAIAAALTLGGAAAVTATSLGGASTPAPNAVCATATWPNIPAACLDGDAHQAVRTVSVDYAPQTAADRFAVAFDLPQSGTASAAVR